MLAVRNQTSAAGCESLCTLIYVGISSLAASGEQCTNSQMREFFQHPDLDNIFTSFNVQDRPTKYLFDAQKQYISIEC